MRSFSTRASKAFLTPGVVVLAIAGSGYVRSPLPSPAHTLGRAQSQYDLPAERLAHLGMNKPSLLREVGKPDRLEPVPAGGSGTTGSAL